jgi:hypothetical protein
MRATAWITRPASPLASTRSGALGRLWWKLAIATNWPILVAVSVLSVLGIISIWADTRDQLHPEWPKQIGFLIAAALCMTAFQAVNYQKIGRFAWPFYIGSLLLIGYTVLGNKIRGLPLVHPVKGQCNWINFGPVSLQPAELMKVGFVLVMARYLRFRSSFRTVRAGGGADGVYPQAAGSGHGAGIHPMSVCDAVRRRRKGATPAGHRGPRRRHRRDTLVQRVRPDQALSARSRLRDVLRRPQDPSEDRISAAQRADRVRFGRHQR